ncbi:hypothetical protein M422DRAFT_167173, partial [Sphaerobolus stellatus SS14]
SLIDVDFEFFDPNPIDFLALKRLIIQLFQHDAELINAHELAELIISQKLVGTTVKTDGIESDPYAYLTVLNLTVHKENPGIKSLIEYLLQKAGKSSDVHSTLQSLLSSQQVGFVFSERLVNMPPQVIPPMYKMLTDEIKWAIDDNEPYNFSHFLFVSRLYRLSAEDEDAMEDVQETSRPAKRAKKKNAGPVPKAGGTYPFHPEDEHIARVASLTFDYNLSKGEPREKDSFGLDVAGRLMVVPADRFPALVQSMAEAYPTPS